MSKKKRKKVVKYKKPFSIANLFFGAILVYMIIYLYMFLTSVHITGYEVIAGSLATDKQFTGLVLREEEIVQADKAGYIDYYAAEGSKVSRASIVYSIDESGRMSEYLQENSEKVSLSDENFTSLKNEISSFSNAYEVNNFSEVYDFHDRIKGSILELSNQTLLKELESLSGEETNAFTRVYANKSGVIGYHLDGYEQVTPDTITPEMFDKSTYSSQNLRNADLISSGDPVYKLITDENWSVIVPVEEEQLQSILYKQDSDENGKKITVQRSVIEVKFLKDNSTSWCYISLLNKNGQQYLQLDFYNSMVRFATERYVDIQFMLEDATGLKIPTSAITTKEFFVIPKEYVIKSAQNKNTEGFMIERFSKDGTAETEEVFPTFYAIIDDLVYIDPNQGDFSSNDTYMEAGDRIILPDSNERYQVGRTEKLEGVYCINQGYTLFRKINVLYSNEEYSIIKEGTSFGIDIYDRIVLDAEAVKENQVIY